MPPKRFPHLAFVALVRSTAPYLVALVSTFAVAEAVRVSGIWRNQPPLQSRVQQLSQSLADATALIDQMKTEIDSRQAMVTKLQGDVETYNTLAALKKEEVEAVAQALRGEIEKSERRSFWEGFGVNTLFFVLGAAVSWWVGKRQMRGVLHE